MVTYLSVSYQEIGTLENSKGIEGAIRHVAESCERLRFVFSESNRHILANMFDDRSKPLYNLCDRITIDRIHENDYIKYINNAATIKWNSALDNGVLDKIFSITERHPYYVNVLCDKIWNECETSLPTPQVVTECWNEYIMQEESKIAKELSTLNPTQQKLLIAIAKGNDTELSGIDYIRELNITSAAIVKSLKLLTEKDYINRSPDGKYFIVDPLIKLSLLTFFPDS